MNAPARLKVFVSHIAEESALGIVIKNKLQDAFSHRIEVFVSSDPGDNPGGDEWLDRIKGELKDPQACMVISLVSPQSVGEPWISIELGAAWILDRSVFPLCHSGQELSALPRPMQDFGGADLAHNDAAVRLVKAVERASRLSVPDEWPVDKFLAAMRSAVSSMKSSATAAGAVHAATAANPEPSSAATVTHRPSDLLAEQISVLQALARAKDHGTDGLQDQAIGRLTSISASKLSLTVDRLATRGLITIALTAPRTIFISPPGVQWLLDEGHL
jgi:hypothetical protein